MNSPTIYPSDKYPQQSEKWMELRSQIPTASQFHRFMDSSFNLKQPKTIKAKEAGEINDSVWTYICELVAEKFHGGPLPSIFNTFSTDQGKINERHARKWFCLEKECELKEVAFIKSGDGLCGCSPDALLGEDFGWEAKCPQMPNHVRYCLEDKLPDEYALQVHGSIYVSQRKGWYFQSYFDGFPTLLVFVERDETIMQKIGESVRQFNDLLTAAFERLKKMP